MHLTKEENSQKNVPLEQRSLIELTEKLVNPNTQEPERGQIEKIISAKHRKESSFHYMKS